MSSTRPPEEEVSNSDGSRTSRVGVEQQEAVHYVAGPKSFEIAGGNPSGAGKQPKGFENDEIEVESLRSMSIKQEVNPKPLDAEPVFFTTEKPTQDIVGEPALPVPSPALNAVTVEQQNGEQDSKDNKGSNYSGTAFEILDVITDPNIRSVSFSRPIQVHEHEPPRDDGSVDHPQECMDGQSVPSTPANHPHQVADSNQQVLGYGDIALRQLVSDYERKNDDKIRKVEAGNFPSYQELSSEPGLVIYDKDKDNKRAGEVYLLHKGRQLGRGGHGVVYNSNWKGKECAVKLAQYCQSELNIWSKLYHPNILPLLGVMLSDLSGNCYQFMPLMTGDLSSMMGHQNGLHGYLSERTTDMWSIISENAFYIVEEILMGMIYLGGMNIQHSDLKAKNVLVLKVCPCEPDILHCQCPMHLKYQVVISDFDTAKQTASPRQPSCSWSEVNAMFTRGVRGTCGYRAPEQNKVCPKQPDFEKTLHDGRVCYDMEGPWSDMWSLGVIVLKMVLGTNDQKYINKARMLLCSNDRTVSARNEAVAASERLKELSKIARKKPELKPFDDIASDCLEVDITERPTAEQVLISFRKCK